MAHIEPTASEDLDGGTIAKAVYQGIAEEDFSTSAVDALLSMVQTGHTDVLGDVLVYLAQRQRPDWAAELCRMVLAGPDGAERDFLPVSTALASMVAFHVQAAAQVCSYILEVKDNGYGSSFFDCFDVSFVLGHMVDLGQAAAAGAILYALYCDESPQGAMYQTLVPHVLGSLLDRGQLLWAVEISKHLMYADGENAIDYQPIGWTMAQMVYGGRPDWAAAICDALLSQQLWWYNQGAVLQAVAAWDPSYPQAIAACMTGGAPPAPRGPPGGWGGRGGGGGYNGSAHGGGRPYYQQQQQGGYGGGYGGGGRGSAARTITSPRGGPGGGLTSPTGGAGGGAAAPPPKENGVTPSAAAAAAAPAARAADEAGGALQAALENLSVADNGGAGAAAAAPAQQQQQAAAEAKETEGAGAGAAAATPEEGTKASTA